MVNGKVNTTNNGFSETEKTASKKATKTAVTKLSI